MESPFAIVSVAVGVVLMIADLLVVDLMSVPLRIYDGCDSSVTSARGPVLKTGVAAKDSVVADGAVAALVVPWIPAYATVGRLEQPPPIGAVCTPGN